jgi:1-acyl-sn-glycerol-3-phosphate acyltransferase
VILYRWVDAVNRPLVNRLYRIRHIASDRIPDAGPVVLAANHESILDPFFLGTVTSRPVHFFAKAELFRVPGLRQILEGLGGIPVRRGADMGRAAAEGVEALERGEVVGIFPQGTCLPYRNRRFQRGAARLALATGAVLVPVLLVGTERSVQPRTHRIGFPQVTIAELRAPYGEPDHAWFPA